MPLRVPTGVNSLVNHTENGFNPLSIFAARVVHPILENLTKPKIFEQYGSWASLGGVFFNSLQQNNSSNDVGSNKFARPLFPNVASVPLKNEIVYIIELPNANIQANTEEVSYYYFQSINLWTSTHHNGIPNPIGNDNIPDSQNKTYSETSTGNVSRISDKGIDIDLGNTFFEKSGSLSIRNLLPYEGDYIYQGRWGNTIRFGSTVTEAPIPNPWSSTGDNGDPIMIFKNGQTTTTDDSWIPQIENINTDLSSIYLTSTQRLPINVSSKSYNSYFSPPVSTNEFDSEQVIINSGRILFNSKNDNILLSSFDTINLNSINSVNIDTPKTIIQSKEIYLGDKYATEPVILGDKFLDDFKGLCSNIVQLCTALSVPIAEYPPLKAVAPLPIKASTLRNQAQKMIGNINRYKSKVSKSK